MYPKFRPSSNLQAVTLVKPPLSHGPICSRTSLRVGLAPFGSHTPFLPKYMRWSLVDSLERVKMRLPTYQLAFPLPFQIRGLCLVEKK